MKYEERGKVIRIDPKTLASLGPMKPQGESMTAFLNRVLHNLAEGKPNDDLLR